MFKGSAHVGADEHSRIIEAVGGFDNAETSDDTTNFFETFPSNYLERVLWLEADRMGSLNVDDANFKSERQVVEEERRVRVDNQPYGTLEEDLRAAAFTVHGYHHTPIGSIEDLDKATLEDVRDFFNTYLQAQQRDAGDRGRFQFQPGAWLDQEIFRGHSGFGASRFRGINTPEPAQTAERDVNKSYSNTPLPAVVIGYKIPARYQPDAYPLDLASNILAGGESSRLYQTLVYKEQIAVQAAGFGNFTEDPNLVLGLRDHEPGTLGAERANKAIEKVLDELKEKPVDAEGTGKGKEPGDFGLHSGARHRRGKGRRAGRGRGDRQGSGACECRTRPISESDAGGHPTHARRNISFRNTRPC